MNTPASRVSTGLVATGISGMDAVLGGGLPCHHIYLVEGESGTGKTTLALQFVLEGKRLGERTLYITLAETRGELYQVAQSHGWTLDGVEIYELTTVGESQRPDEQYTLFYPSEVELSENIRRIQEQVERLNPVRVVLDSLSGLRLLAEDPLRYRRQIEYLRLFLVRKACTVLMLDDDVAEQGSFQPRSLAHGVFSMEQIVQQYGTERRRLRVVKLRGVELPGGYHDFKIVHSGVIIYPRLVAAEHANEITRKPLGSGLPELDAMLADGLIRGDSALLIGPAGSGKSTLAVQYALALAAQGEASAFYLFDEHVATFTLRTALIGMDIEPWIGQGLIRLQNVDPAAMSPGEFACHIQEQVERHGVRLVVIDSLGGYLHGMPQERFLNLHLQELLSYLNRKGVICLLIMVQHGLIGTEIKTPADLSSIADTVILLRYFEAQGEIRQSITVIKKRTGGHERTIREFHIGPKGIRLGEPLKNFHGILSGLPRYVGSEDPLLETDS